MVRAEVRGLSAGERYDPDDPNWWLRLQRVAEELADEERRGWLVWRRDRLWRLLDGRNLTQEDRDRLSQSLQELETEYAVNLFPWAEESIRKSSEGVQQQAAETHAEMFGRPGDQRYEEMVKQQRQQVRAFHEMDANQRAAYEQHLFSPEARAARRAAHRIATPAPRQG